MRDFMVNPFSFNWPVPPGRFVGRWTQVQEVAANLLNPGGHSHALVGGRRFGKTSFLLALQKKLFEQLVHADESGQYIFPVFVSLRELKYPSPEGVLAHMIRTLHQNLAPSQERVELGVTFEFNMNDTRLVKFLQNREQTCSLELFSAILEELLERFSQEYGVLSFVFLLDETDDVLGQDWTEELFSLLRALIYMGALSRYVRCVLAGSSQMTEVREKGSPLLNMLKMVYLEALSDEDILGVIHWANNVHEDFANSVLKQCGGHPFLAQYIMHWAWRDLQDRIHPSISTLIARFRRERLNDLVQWGVDLGEYGLSTYNILVEAGTELTELEVKQHANNEQLIPRIGLALVNLCCNGLVVQDGTWSKYRVAGELFKNWFVEDVPSFVTVPPSSRDQVNTFVDTDPRVEVHIANNHIFPTAYCHTMTADTFPFVTCIIDNRGPFCTTMRATIEVTIRGFSEPSTDTLDVSSGKLNKSLLLPTLNDDGLSKLTEIKKAKCWIQVKRHLEGGVRPLFEKDYDIQVYPLDTALIATWRREKLSGSEEIWVLKQDLADSLAVLVTSHHEKVERLVRLAANRLPRNAGSGYQGAEYSINGQRMVNLEETRRISRQQARAFFETLKRDVRLRYTNALVNFGKQPDQTTQRVRPPFVCLPSGREEGQANCLEGSILFSSLLENVGMEPLIVLVPEHAFVGWRIWSKVDEYDFLETTMIGTSGFQAALDVGNRRYYEAIQNGDDQRSLYNDDGFMRIIDITACRSRGINPLK